MINYIKNNITIRRGFVIAAFLIIISNFIFMVGFYSIYLNNQINISHVKAKESLTTQINEIKEELSCIEDIDTYLSEYAKKNKVIIELDTEENINVKTYSYKDNKRIRSNISISKIVEYKDNYYLLTITKEQDLISGKIIIRFFLFDLLILIALGIAAISGANQKILNPVTTLSKDVNNYKLGILPKKKRIRNGIDVLQNEFVELVDKLEDEKLKQNTIIASISHDIKTPLTSILGYSELASKETTSPKTKEKYLNTIHKQALVMKEIVEEFDDYLSCNIKDEKKVEIISISSIVAYLNDYYKEDLKEKDIDFKVKTNCPNLMIEVDLSKFKRVFSNTITNSIRHYDKDKKILNINIIDEKNGKIKFEIVDNGSGCKEDLVKIFDPLYTTDNSRKISGLGLSICKEIIESHNGTIKATNNKLGGFSIIFTIDSYKED